MWRAMSLADGKSMPFRYYQGWVAGRGRSLRSTVTSGAMIFDGTTGDMITIMPEQKKYMIMNSPRPAVRRGRLGDAMSGGGAGGKAPDFSKMKVTATGQRETIAGITCEHYLSRTRRKRRPADRYLWSAGPRFMGMAVRTTR